MTVAPSEAQCQMSPLADWRQWPVHCDRRAGCCGSEHCRPQRGPAPEAPPGVKIPAMMMPVSESPSDSPTPWARALWQAVTV